MARTRTSIQYIDLYEAVTAYIAEENVDVKEIARKMGKSRSQMSGFISVREYVGMRSCRKLADALQCDLRIVMYDPKRNRDFDGISEFLESLGDSAADKERATAAYKLIPFIARDEDAWREAPDRRITTKTIYQLARSIGCIPLMELTSRNTGKVYSMSRESCVENSEKIDALIADKRRSS